MSPVVASDSLAPPDPRFLALPRPGRVPARRHLARPGFASRSEAIAASCEATARIARLIARAAAAQPASIEDRGDDLGLPADADGLLGISPAFASELRQVTERLARAERAAGSPPQYVLKLLRSIVECTRPLGIEPELIYSLEQDIIMWGVEGYLAG